jgi:hypothetical protein
MNKVILHNNTVVETFKWKDKDDNFHNPQDMHTRHIFFTLRMIWNHIAPHEMRIEPYKRYRFGKFYTAEYIKESIKVLYAELRTRNDLTPYFKKCLEIIRIHANALCGRKLIDE